MRKKSQTWSLDIFFATAFFLLALLVFFFVVSENENNKSDKSGLEKESRLIPVELSKTENDIGIIKDNAVDTDELIKVANMSYEELKEGLGVKHDFCIYFEDQDGNLIDLSSIIGKDVVGIGSSQIMIEDKPCGG